MLVNFELLVHCKCDFCGAWWSIADRKIPPSLYCPDCGHLNLITETQGPLSLESNENSLIDKLALKKDLPK